MEDSDCNQLFLETPTSRVDRILVVGLVMIRRTSVERRTVIEYFFTLYGILDIVKVILLFLWLFSRSERKPVVESLAADEKITT